MSIITTTNNNFNYKSPPEFISFNLQNDTTQTFSGDIRKVKEYNFNMTYENGIYANSVTNNFNENNYTVYYVITNITITKPSNNNISFYQISEAVQRNDPCAAYPANKNSLVDTINWIYLTSTSITNGTRIRLYLYCYNDNENLLNIQDLTVTANVKCYPVY